MSDPRQPAHGTTGEYTNNCCRCQPCKDAWAAYCRDRKRFIRAYGALVPGWRDQLRLEMTTGSK